MSDQAWHVTIEFSETGDRTRADAILQLSTQRFHGFGQAKRAPQDPSIPIVGEDLAAARALSHLSHQLLDAAAERIGQYEGRPVELHG